METAEPPSFGSSTANASFHVKPDALSSIKLDKGSVVSGTTATVTGTVTLFAPCLVTTLVTLKSSNTSAATVPVNVTLSPGDMIATFPVTVPMLTVQKTATISATYNAITKSVILTVAPLAPLSVQMVPGTVTGGVSSIGKVTLNGTPLANATVALACNNLAASVPSTVTVLAGSTNVSFTALTSPVSANTACTISGTLNALVKTVVLTVKAPAISSLVLTPTSVNGGISISGKVTLTGNAAVNTSVAITSANAAVQVPATVTVPKDQTA